MKRILLTSLYLFAFVLVQAQIGHVMQGVGAFNTSMGGASTGQPLEISGAIHWNPASISAFNQNIIKLDLGLLFASPEVSSSLPADFIAPGVPAVSGTTEDDKGIVPIPTLAMVWASEESKHTFAASAIGTSGFGIVFPEEANNPLSPTFNPGINSNPINYPQAAGGFGRVESQYIMLQMSFSWAYELNDRFSIGIQPNIDYASLELMPNPTAPPTAGYPTADQTSSIGFGGQVGLFFDSGEGFSAGLSYKTTQYFGDFEFDNTYLDQSTGTNKFNLDFPSILSLGIGYSKELFDVAVDYRLVNYENTDGFAETGWNTTNGSVIGFGWNNMSVVSAGVQFKGIEKIPLRLGYTYSTNPIQDELAMFSVPATGVIENSFQFGLSFIASEQLSIDASYQYATSAGATTGNILSPLLIGEGNPYGAIPGTSVSYKMTTGLASVGVSYRFN